MSKLKSPAKKLRTRVCIVPGESSIIQWTSLYSVGCDIFKLRRPTLRVRDVKYDSSKRRGRFRALWKFYYLYIYRKLTIIIPRKGRPFSRENSDSQKYLKY